MIDLRPYQREAVDAIFAYFGENTGHPIVSLPTASGKSVVQAALIQETLAKWPGERFLLVSHVKELLEQNASKLSDLDVGIYSAGLGRRDIKQVTVAGIQSIYKRAHEVGNVSIVIVDECFTADTMIMMGDGSSKRIASINPGDVVMSFDGNGESKQTVTATSSTKTKKLVNVMLSGHNVIKCTNNHPFLTTRGWIKAGELTNADEVLCCLRKRVYDLPKPEQEIMRDEVRPGSFDTYEKKVDDCRSFVKSENSIRRIGENEEKKSNGERRDKKKAIRNAEENRMASSYQGRKRTRNHEASKNFGACAWLVRRACCCNWEKIKGWISSLLQNRHSKSTYNGCRGGGWRVSLLHKGKRERHEKRQDAFVFGLVSIESVKQVSIGGFETDIRVYNIEVSGTHNYILSDSGSIVHNCHLISKTSETMYRRFFDDLRSYCPSVKVIGLSATPFRLDSGPLIKGDNRLFTDICYSASMLDLIEQGYLSPIRTAHVNRRVDSSGVSKRGGEYIAGDLERLMDKEAVTNAALDEVEVLCDDRRSWLVFCSGVEHAGHVAESIRARGYTSEVVVGDTPSAERESRIEAFKRGEIRSLVSVSVLTTGFDAPNADALICLRPTCSPGLWLQMVGRVTRLSPGKVDGLVVDFTSNTRDHGPVDQITIDGDGNVKPASCRVCIYCQGLIPPKLKACPDCGREQGRVCPVCSCPMDPGVTQCPGCGLETVREPRKPNHKASASDAPILSSQAPLVESATVTDMHVMRHRKQGSPDSVRVEYWCGLQKYSEWICFDHNGYARDKARSWWRWGRAPRTTDEALSRAAEIAKPREISVKRDGKYWRVVSRIY